MDVVLKDCQNNLNGLNKSKVRSASSLERTVNEATAGGDPPQKRTHVMPIGRGGTSLSNSPAEERAPVMPIGRGGISLSKEQMNNLIDVGGLQCDCCKCKSKKLL
eukprot:scaffold32311_cov124-Skeletonema_marinoi.AAC.1